MHLAALFRGVLDAGSRPPVRVASYTLEVLEELASAGIASNSSDCALVLGYVPSCLDFEQVHRLLKRRYNAPCILTSTAGELSSSGKGLYVSNEHEPKVLIQEFSKSLFERVEMHTIELPCEDILDGENRISPSVRRERIAKQLSQINHEISPEPGRSLVLTLVNGFSHCENWLMEAVYQDGRFSQPFIGGSTGCLPGAGHAPFHDEQALRNQHALLCFIELHEDFYFRLFKSDNFLPSEHNWMVAESDPAERTVSKLLCPQDSRPREAIEVLCQQLDCQPEELQQRLVNYSFATPVAGELFVRSVSWVDLEKRCLHFYCDVPFGAELILMEQQSLSEQTERDYQSFAEGLPQPLGGVLFDCIQRRRNNPGELEKIKCFKDFPIAGFSTFGELFGVNLNETLCAVFFYSHKDGRDSQRDAELDDYNDYSGYFKRQQSVARNLWRAIRFR
ncbi:FIST signal transduction protein [Aliagarivorans marinus]|uniref:FIST signal transduction protein n=1 Tax=Aliagarivorans marinus TaxID=561965 RepID=UPI00047E8FAD|nr:FIST N-terminal domain-containing protein [Aliagarivorans marinus]